VCSADLQLAFPVGRFNNLTDALESEVRKGSNESLLPQGLCARRQIFGKSVSNGRRSCYGINCKELFQCLVTNKKATKITVVDSSVSNEDIIKGQRSDYDLKASKRWLEKDLKPDWQEISRRGPTVVDQEILAAMGFSSTAKSPNHWQMGKFRWKTPCLTKHSAQFLQSEEIVLRELHESRRGGHIGVNQTLARIRDYLYL